MLSQRSVNITWRQRGVFVSDRAFATLRLQRDVSFAFVRWFVLERVELGN